MSDQDALEKALNQAFLFGTQTATGYLSGLISMSSRRTLGEGDEAASKIRQQWPGLRERLLKELTE